MRALARCFPFFAFLVLLAHASFVAAQQYGPGVVLDPNTLGNLNLIFEREQVHYEGEVRRATADLPRSWNDLALRAFRAGEYAAAANAWRHALVDEPRTGAYALRLAQAEFAAGNYVNAAEAIHLAMSLLPESQWGEVVKNYRQLYARSRTFSNQMRELEQARNENPADAAMRFVLGYQYLYLGYPEQALKQLNKATELAPDDLLARYLAAVAAVTSGPLQSEAASAAELAAEEADASSVPADTQPATP
ncbi:MAG: hypothetical protein K2Y37_22550 [Pirellulales bacterium]|nr:hypothetical protein [Pirellulales bacterium]